MAKHLSFLLLTVFLFGCGNTKKEPQVITKNNLFQITLPSDMSDASWVNKKADLMYGNLMGKSYAYVVKEDKQVIDVLMSQNGYISGDMEPIDGYARAVCNSLTKKLGETEISPIEKTNINSLNARIFKMEITPLISPLYYTIAIVEGKGYYYQVASYNSGIVDSEELKNQRIGIINSFKELKN